MNGNSHDPRGFSIYATNWFPRWRRVFFALVMTLAIGGVNQTAPAQAARAGDLTSYIWLDASTPGSRTICVGEQAVIRVNIYMRLWLDEKRLYDGRVVPAEITHLVVGDYGTVSPKKLSTSVTNPSADFTFTAKKPGEVTVVLGGAIPVAEIWGLVLGSRDVGGTIDLTVIDCEYKVTTISRWNNGPISLIATMDGKMKSDDQGHLTGTGTVKWVTIFTIPDGNTACGGSRGMSATDSQADLTGEVGDSGQVTANITYQPTTFSISGSCSTGSGGGEETMAPAPLTITVASPGGVSTQTQALTGIPGAAIITVFPER